MEIRKAKEQRVNQSDTTLRKANTVINIKERKFASKEERLESRSIKKGNRLSKRKILKKNKPTDTKKSENQNIRKIGKYSSSDGKTDNSIRRNVHPEKEIKKHSLPFEIQTDFREFSYEVQEAILKRAEETVKTEKNENSKKKFIPSKVKGIAQKSYQYSKAMSKAIIEEVEAETEKQKYADKFFKIVQYQSKKGIRYVGKKVTKIVLDIMKKIIKAIAVALGKAFMALMAAIGPALLVIFIIIGVLFGIFVGMAEEERSIGRVSKSAVPLYLQWDDRWGSQIYGDGTIKETGCGPTSVSMVVSYFLQEEITPDIVVNWAGDRYYLDGIGSTFELYPAAAQEYELVYKQVSVGDISEELGNGRVIIASATGEADQIFTSSGHLIVLRGIDQAGNILVNDPNDNDTKDYYSKAFPLETIARECQAYFSYWKKGFEPSINTVMENDLELLAKIVMCEAGSDWITDEHQQLVASVVMNRVNSPHFPDTIEEVIFQTGQYAPTWDGSWESTVPNERTYENARYVLENGSIAPSNVIYQANFAQGSGVYKRFENPYTSDQVYKYTYFCY